MFKSQFVLLCFSCLVVRGFTSSVSYINKCRWDDNDCMTKSTNTAISYFATGKTGFKIPPLDPLHIDKSTLNEGGLNVDFKDIVLTGTKDCKAKDVERNLDEKWLKVSLECPIDVRGLYTASGKLFAQPIEGDGPFHVQSKHAFITIQVELTDVNGKDGKKHWHINNPEYTIDFKDQPVMEFSNLFKGNEELARPILAIFEQNGKEILKTVGKPIITKFVDSACSVITLFIAEVPSEDLELK